MDLALTRKILEDLDPDQAEAVTSTEGPLLVIAGPGSGKTRVITYRFAYIVLANKAKPHEILCLTFTNKAANEMRNRILKLTGASETLNFWIKTFHSLGLSIIKEFYNLLGLNEKFVVYDKEDQLKLIKSIVKKYNFKELSPERIMEIIDDVRYGNQELPDTFGEIIKEITQIYQEEIRKNNAVDFVDLIVLPYKLIKENEEVRSYYKKKWKYMMVDEFQDTDPLQYDFIKTILNENRNICVVGDDDQSIYGWRGANVENIRNFDKDFKDCKIVILKTNYRSTEKIINLSNYISSNMLFRRKDKIIKGTGIEGITPVFIETYDQISEAEIIAKKIHSITKNGYKYKDIAVFYRTNYLSRLLEEALIKNRIPYRIYSGVSFYERAEVKDIISYLRFSVNQNDFISFSRAINIPKRGIGEKSLSKILDFSMRNNKNLLESLEILKENGLKGIDSFLEAINILLDNNKSISTRVKELIEKIDYYHYLSQNYDNYEERIENVEELIRAISDFEESGGRTLEEFINTSILLTNSDEVDEKENCVSLMTLHISKGLEFPVVFIFGAIDGIIPHFKNTYKPSLIDEERRLFYVGVTRAKEILTITSSRFTRIGSIKHSFVSPTRFIDEIPDKYLKIIRLWDISKLT
ncbi:MAG: ATP-dependent helicase [Brevinematia bacterium]